MREIVEFFTSELSFCLQKDMPSLSKLCSFGILAVQIFESAKVPILQIDLKILSKSATLQKGKQ